ncbi:hypothetical protein EJ110_NYTH31453 [Nymphaea thermarum]|nr:hypothetical protein EJ110_NYTH31453 [Nymphaea thermarum]
MRFHFVLAGWEGSATDSRVLYSALDNDVDPLVIPTGLIEDEALTGVRRLVEDEAPTSVRLDLPYLDDFRGSTVRQWRATVTTFDDRRRHPVASGGSQRQTVAEEPPPRMMSFPLVVPKLTPTSSSSS